MRLAFYAPLKPPDHPTPSGDRLMAGLLVRALGAAGHEVQIASSLRTYSASPAGGDYRLLRAAAEEEAARLIAMWSQPGASVPDGWFTYHPYFKAPDWIGPAVCARFGLPYLTAEASYAGKRDAGPWGPWQADVAVALRQSAANFCFTPVDREGLERLGLSPDTLVDLPPFIEPPAFPAKPRRSTAAPRIAVVAMMRFGDKVASYLMLSAALQTLVDLPWRLAVMGDGPARGDVLAAFAPLPADRIDWLGEVEPETVAAELSACDLYVWPGTGEAYGLAYLEAQAMGLPVVAQDTAGVPAVVENAVSGLLTPAGDVAALAHAIRGLLGEPELRLGMGGAASRFVRERRSVASAAAILDAALTRIAAQGRIAS